MPDLHLPVDHERLPEYRSLLAGLDARQAGGWEVRTPPAALAAHWWNRLWVDLAYQAETTNRPGLLTPAACDLFLASLDPAVRAVALPALREAGVLELEEASEDRLAALGVPPPPDALRSHHCPRFARHNAHLAGNHKPAHIRGNEQSAHVRGRRNIEADAARQMVLLPVELYRDRNGQPLDSTRIRECIVLIRTLDNILRRAPRLTTHYTETLFADACAVLQAHGEGVRELFFKWLIDRGRDHPAVPKSAEQILAAFPDVLMMMGKGGAA